MKKTDGIINPQFLPKGSALLKFALSFCLLLAIPVCTQAQTTVTLPDCVDCPTGGVGSGESSGSVCLPLTCALDVLVERDGATVIIACDGSLWVTSTNAQRYKGAEILFDISVADNANLDLLFSIPTRISGPNNDAVKFVKILEAGTRFGYIAAITDTGESWVYSIYQPGFNYAGNLNPLALSTFIGTTPATGSTGWFRLVSGTGANIKDISYASEMTNMPLRFYLDTDGLVWIGGRDCTPSGGASFTPNKWIGLNGGPCTGTATSSWSQLTIPNNDPITAIATSLIIAPRAFITLMVGASGTLYWFGNTDNGYPAIPTVMSMPGGVAAVDVYQTQTGVYIKGADGKLYFTGKELPGNFTIVGGGATIDNAGTVIEVAAWTATGKSVGDVFTLQEGTVGGESKAVYVISADNVFYYAIPGPIGNYVNQDIIGTFVTLPSGSRGDQFYLYDDEAGANLDYSSGLIKVAFGGGGGKIYLLTNNTLTYAGAYKSDDFAGGYETVAIPSLQGLTTSYNYFPNVYFIRYCNGEIPLIPNNRGYYENTEIISVPPN